MYRTDLVLKPELPPGGSLRPGAAGAARLGDDCRGQGRGRLLARVRADPPDPARRPRRGRGDCPVVVQARGPAFRHRQLQAHRTDLRDADRPARGDREGRRCPPRPDAGVARRQVHRGRRRGHGLRRHLGQPRPRPGLGGAHVRLPLHHLHERQGEPGKGGGDRFLRSRGGARPRLLRPGGAALVRGCRGERLLRHLRPAAALSRGAAADHPGVRPGRGGDRLAAATAGNPDASLRAGGKRQARLGGLRAPVGALRSGASAGGHRRAGDLGLSARERPRRQGGGSGR